MAGNFAKAQALSKTPGVLRPLLWDIPSRDMGQEEKVLLFGHGPGARTCRFENFMTQEAFQLPLELIARKEQAGQSITKQPTCSPILWVPKV